MSREKDDLVGLDIDLVTLVKDLRDSYSKEDRAERDKQRPLWLKLENYFNGIQRIYWDMVAKDYRLLPGDSVNASNRHYDKIINIYRPHGESIIAALSVKPPSAIFFPDDADVEEDITTAKICVKIKEDLERVNHAKLLLIKALMILWNQGTVFSYVYNDKNSKYGTYTTPTMGENVKQYTVLENCPECGNNIGEQVFHGEKGKVEEISKRCQICGYEGIPIQEEYEEDIPQISGSKINPKSKTCIELFSPLFVHVPFYARKQEHIPYLKLIFEQHYSSLKNLYPKLKKKGFTPHVERLSSEDRGIEIGINDSNLCTVECFWCRNWGYDLIDGKDEQIKKLKAKFPEGFYSVHIDDQLVEIHSEDLDNHWVLSDNPLSTYLHGQPLGKPLAPIQDIKNEVVDLQIETFEQAIPETFVRGDVLNFEKYGKAKAQPGMVYPVLPPNDGTPISGAFHTLKTATLSEENDVFNNRLDNAAQFVSGSFPSIYGGPATSGSKTAREYTESRAMALQRLGLPWDIIKFFWAGVMSIAVPLRISSLRRTGKDEKIVEKTKTGFVNTWIKQTDLEGKIGRVEADAEEGLPLTPAQLKDTVLQLMTLKDEFINEALYHPNNTPLITKALGSPDFFIPGSDDRNKQIAEFSDLLNGIAVEVNPTVDNNPIEAEVCRSFLVSSTGLMIKKSNPEGWMAIENHMIDHLEAEKMKAVPQEGVTEDVPIS